MRDDLGSGIAAFFDLDGTLIGEPSLERRFLAELRRHRAIPSGNYFRWLARALRLLPWGIETMRHANKMYLRGLRRDVDEFTEAQSRRQKPVQARMAPPRFLPAAMERVSWHARQGHGIVLVSGTLAPLADEMAVALVVRLAVRGVTASVGVCGTQLEEAGGRWTGRIAGDAMFGPAKARALRRIAAQSEFDLSRCYAYGNSLSDRWMLEAVGRAVAVNPSRGMEKLARRRGWAVVRWAEKDESTMQPATRHAQDEAERVA